MRSGRSGWILVLLFAVAGAILWVTISDALIGQIFVGVAVFLALVNLFITLFLRRTRIPDALQGMPMPGNPQAMGMPAPTQPTAWGTPAAGMPAAGTNPANITIPGASSTFMAGNDVGQAVMAALKQYGMDISGGGTFDLRNVPAAREAVLKALSDHGVDVAHQIAAMAPGLPIQQSGEPVEAMTKLKQLKDAGLISNDDFEQNKKRILGGL